MSSRHLLVLFTAGVLAAACERSTPAADSAPHWKLDSAVTLTGPNPETPFNSVRGLALHTDGRLVVVDHGVHSVLIFPPDGRRGSEASTFGAGPGDYKEPYYAAWLGDTLAIYDPELTRVLVLDANQKPAADIPTLKMTGGIAVRFYPVSAAKAYMRSVRLEGTTLRPMFVGFANGRATDTVAFAMPADLATGASCRAPNGATTFFDWPEAPFEIVVPVRADGAIASARSDAYRIVVRSASGDSLAVLQRSVEPAPLTTSEWNEALLPYNTFLMKNGSTSCDARPTRPPHRALVRAITVSAEGDVWVTALHRDGLTFDVFSTDGTLKGSIPAPAHDTSIPIVVAGDHLAMVAAAPKGAKGTQVVQVYRIVR